MAALHDPVSSDSIGSGCTVARLHICWALLCRRKPVSASYICASPLLCNCGMFSGSPDLPVWIVNFFSMHTEHGYGRLW